MKISADVFGERVVPFCRDSAAKELDANTKRRKITTKKWLNFFALIISSSL
jgi:hypothetical protein